ncbi:MAG TPA: hypothetical protein VF576_02425 [Rubricoccaceae bacterium]|jgi:hypothetical protein
MKSVLLYVALVGLPTLGVLGVIRLGGLISPPPAVGGLWRVEGGGAACVVPGDGVFEIVQSGEYVHVSVPGRSDVAGRLVRGVLRAQGGARAGISPGCAQSAVTIRARVGQGVAERIEGTMGVPGCGGCPPAAFSAVRVAPTSD